MSEQQNVKGPILLVDDESSVLEALKSFFEDEGYEVTTASDGLIALEQLKQTSFDLVVTDIFMPKMSGIDLLKTIKTEYPLVEVIMITGFGSEASKKEALDLGAYDYFDKPLNILALLRSVFECLDKAKDKK